MILNLLSLPIIEIAIGVCMMALPINFSPRMARITNKGIVPYYLTCLFILTPSVLATLIAGNNLRLVDSATDPPSPTILSRLLWLSLGILLYGYYKLLEAKIRK